jgi:hypothetical protein
MVGTVVFPTLRGLNRASSPPQQIVDPVCCCLMATVWCPAAGQGRAAGRGRGLGAGRGPAGRAGYRCCATRPAATGPCP